MKRMMAIFGVLALLAVPALTGEWHQGTNNLCTDCHTMHSSQQHQWGSTSAVSATPVADGNWLAAGGPNNYLLKDGPTTNDLCLACHNGQSFAPDVFGTDVNNIGNGGRMAGALNDTTGTAPYQTYKGHTLNAGTSPPGYDSGDSLSADADEPWDGGTLECVDCHEQHGAPSYRNLGPDKWGAGTLAEARPTYVISNTNDPNFDVWIDQASHTPNTSAFGNITNFNVVNYNRQDRVTAAGNNYANKMDNFCGACHGTWHGGPTDTNTGPNSQVAGSGRERFSRHPSVVTIGAVGDNTHSDLTYYATDPNILTDDSRVKAYTNDYTSYTNTSPGCVTCHKAHGNQNPFGLFLLHIEASTVTEQGGLKSGQTEMTNGYGIGYMDLCGQCHGQGINVGE